MPCGICGFVGLSDENLLRRMCDAIKHRGPDSTGFYLDAGIGLGIDRLKIIDLAKGDQPIHNEDGSVWLVFNGEIYNYRALRTELETRGHRFYTESDTETIVHAYEEWDDDCVKHLNGMFAFAIWDAKRRRLYVARDRFGKKPFHYHMTKDGFIFASEIKAILQFQEFQRTIDDEAVDYFFTYGYIPSPLSIFQGIRKLPAGHFGVYENGSFRIAQYWDYTPSPENEASEDSLVDELYQAAKNAVRIRLMSEVPLGAFLSGGIDSSLVVSLMKQLSQTPVKTVSIDFDDELSESRFSQRVADFLGTEHHTYTVHPDAFKSLPSMVWHFDEPFADHSLIPTFYLSQVTKKVVTVALSGDGGDELFMGYPFLSEPRSYQLYSHVPRPLRRSALRLLRALPVNKSFRRMANQAYEKDYDSQTPAERYAMRMSILDYAGLRRLYSQEYLKSHRLSQTYSYEVKLVHEANTADILDSLDYATIKSYLEEDILVKVDRMSMANSLEVRCPFLDQDLVSLAERIPSRLKVNGSTRKYLLKRMAMKESLLPKEIVYRKKQGFGAPVESWLRKDWKDIVDTVLDPVITSNYTGFFDGSQIKTMLRDPYLYSNRLFAMVIFVIWYRSYIEEGSLASPQHQGLAS